MPTESSSGPTRTQRIRAGPGRRPINDVGRTPSILTCSGSTGRRNLLTSTGKAQQAAPVLAPRAILARTAVLSKHRCEIDVELTEV